MGCRLLYFNLDPLKNCNNPYILQTLETSPFREIQTIVLMIDWKKTQM